ncbi:DNA polymerase/3'-5' exonuclease PolX [Candidatus Bipolaricaulota bacterium]|nr:DNA polymerase/3'-5' exonuclease PolX [Candidatus Bipolaricaulota bacterium]MCF7891077.1 DNA polymerase/3'-5' exonuclease PolX [Candidatus Bipolaricaulota bacterium]
MSTRKQVVEILNQVADLLEIKGVDYKPRAYRRAAREIDSLTEDLTDIYEEGRLEDIPSVGKNTAEKIAEILETEKLEYYEELKKEIPIDPELLKVRNLGPKKVKKIWDELDLTSLAELEEALKSGKIREIKGFGPKSEENILKGLKIVKESQGKSHLSEVLPEARRIKEGLVDSSLFDKVSFAGSLRRRKYEVGDVDILATAGDRDKAMDHYTTLDGVEEVLSKGETKSSVRIKTGLRVDLRIVDSASFGSALQYFTGSQEHNVRLRQLAISKGYKLNEYGLYAEEAEEKVAGAIEEEMYQKLDLSWIPPELREDRGEIQAAGEGELPGLIEGDDVMGDLHCHSARSSDSHIPLDVLVREARKRNYSYLAVTDHAEISGIVGGLTDDRVAEHVDQIESANSAVEELDLLAGAEVNIQPDGTLDLGDGSLKELDVVIAGVHSHFDRSRAEMTERTVRAMENPNVDIIAHPTGRKIGERGSFDLDWGKIFARAEETGTALEINASPARTDLEDKLIKRAKEEEVKLTIGTDSHRVNHLDYMELGLNLARRGWCEKANVLNTLPLSDLRAWLAG